MEIDYDSGGAKDGQALMKAELMNINQAMLIPLILLMY